MGAKSRLEKLEDVRGFLRNDCAGDLSIADVCKLAEVMVDSTQSFFASLDSVIYSEIRELSAYIENAQDEISALQPNDLHQQKIPDAGKQLDAIVKSTEDATNRIMEQAEKIMAANPLDMDSYQQTVNDAVMEIFEACSFQDLTGQRISKVVETLQHIERRVSKFAEAVKVKDGALRLSQEELAREQRAAEQLLHGPPLEGEGVSQDIVDQLLDAAPAAVTAEVIDMPVAEPEDTAEADADVSDLRASIDEVELAEEVGGDAEAEMAMADAMATEEFATVEDQADEDRAAAEQAAEEQAAAEKAAAEKAAAEKAAAEKAAAEKAAAEKVAAEKATAEQAAAEKAAAEQAAAEKAAAEKAAAEKAAADKAAAEKSAAKKAEDDKVAAAKAAAAAMPKPELEEFTDLDAGKENSQDDIDALFA